MADHVYKLVELTGSSTTTMEDAVHNAIARAAKTVRNMRWFQVVETRGHSGYDASGAKLRCRDSAQRSSVRREVARTQTSHSLLFSRAYQ
ncbi:MAG: dodecin domain-containing protein [Ignavibacteria bacterium]|nr:dodecin domain-containing protein [Ignavibacteria bacterium]